MRTVLLLLVLVLPGGAWGQVFYAEDQASNYTTATWNASNNLGYGFQDWVFESLLSPRDSFLVVDPALAGLGGVNGLPNPSFGLLGYNSEGEAVNPGYASVQRTFAPLPVGGSVSFDWAVNLASNRGFRGVQVHTNSNSSMDDEEGPGAAELSLFVQNDGTITLNGTTLDGGAGTRAMRVILTRTPDNEIHFSMTRRDGGGLVEHTVSVGAADVNRVVFFVTNVQDGSLERGLYFNNLAVSVPAAQFSTVPADATVRVKNSVNAVNSSPTTLAALTIETGSTLTLNANLTVTGAYAFPSMASITGSGELRLRPIRSVAGTGSGWRLLGAPANGITVCDLAARNHVQSPNASDNAGCGNILYRASPLSAWNLRTAYFNRAGVEGFQQPAGHFTELTPGRGFLWYMWGTDTGSGRWSALEAGNNILDPVSPRVVNYSNVVVALSGNEVKDTSVGNWLMLSNPFPMTFSAVYMQTTASIQSGAFIVNGNTYTTIADRATLDVDAWQGFFVQVNSSVLGNAIIFPVAGTSTTAADHAVGGKNGAHAFAFRMGTSGHVNGRDVVDQLGQLYFHADAQTGFDAYELGVPPQLSAPLFMLMPTGPWSGGEATTLSVRSLPINLEEIISVPYQVYSAQRGTFTTTWADLDNLPQEWAVTLTDALTGEKVNLRNAASYTFTTESGTFDRFLLTIDPTGTATSSEGLELPSGFALSAPAPNPFRSGTTLDLRVETAQRVTAALYDVLGREVAQLFTGDVAPGQVQQIRVNGETLNAGVYFVRVEGESFTETRRLVRVE